MKLYLWSLFGFAAVVCLLACSSSTSTAAFEPGPDGGGLTASDDGGAPGADAASAACNAIVQHGPSVQIYETSTTPFVPTHGTLLDGTYMLTSGERYATDNIDEIGDVIATENGTIEITGTTIQTVTTTATSETRSTLTVSKTDTGELTFASTCQSPAGDAGTTAAMAGTYQYLVNTDEIILELQVSKGVVLTQRFTRM